MPSPLGCRFIKQNITTECRNTTLDNVLHALKILNTLISASYKPRSIVIEDCVIPYLPYVFPKFNESLERIKLVQSQLEYVYPDAFDHLQNKLHYLDLSHNKLHSVPYAFSTLHSLEILNLQYNQIVFIWPGPQFRWMFNLREFNLAYNQIGFSSDYVPDVRKLTIQEPVSGHLYQLAQNLTLEEFNIEPVTSSLEIFNLSGNNLATLPAQLYQRRLPSLKILDLSNNFLSELPKLTAHLLPGLRRLSLRLNLIETLYFYSLPTDLEELNFSGKIFTTLTVFY
ncbi:leucine-rich repeat-containing G-protein coupled receptor 5-like [Limulus polyphemus]|uniref:Leucine-rich repeat-containing G-protein coupled receptor 5-like n=1 Tax=Limulus polyphemus TaxID=6850 RepID=A0ABM1BRF2_LIMPO|nr:leucine-rich repeat-containing G-protein coupled receptor 5-like [Limulus polyphemus]